MLNFTRYFFKQRFNRKFVVNSHHLKICEALDKVISGEIKKLIINIAPRYSKTEIAVKNFMAYGLAINPSARFIHLSYSDDLALDNSEEVKEICKSAEYQQMFPNVKISAKSDSKKKWYTTKKGGVYATATAGQVTGFGAGIVDEEFDEDFVPEESNKFGGALIIDDPIKPEEADSETVRTKINERWDSTIKNRVNSRNTPIIIIMQRLHENDLCGYLMEQNPDEWTVIKFPAIENEIALWPFKHTLEELYAMKEENEVVFERQYQQDPKPLKGLLFPSQSLNYFSLKDLRIEEAHAKIGYIDVADEGNDSLSFPIAHIFPEKVFITDVIFTTDGIEITVPLCAERTNTLKLSYIRIETNNQGGGFIRDIKKVVSPEKVWPVKTTSNKETRILDASGFIKKYFYFRNDYEKGSDYHKFMKELTGYLKNPKGEQHDDAPDSLAGLKIMIESGSFVPASLFPKSYFQ